MKVLYAEDEKELSAAVTTILKLEGFEVDNAYNGQEALELLDSNFYDVCVFDIMMPIVDGVEVLRKMRSQENFTPVLMLTAKTTTDDKILGLDSGADDYLGKPFETKELIARIKSLVRRSSASYQPVVLTVGNMQLNCENNNLTGANGSVVLSAKESKLLSLFMKNPNICFTIDMILDKIMGEDFDKVAVKLYVSYLQDKMEGIQADSQIDFVDDAYCLCV